MKFITKFEQTEDQLELRIEQLKAARNQSAERTSNLDKYIRAAEYQLDTQRIQRQREELQLKREAIFTHRTLRGA